LAKVVGALVRRGRADDLNWTRAMDRALRDECLWVRRIAAIHQLGWYEETDTRRLFAYATQLAAERDFFIRKAIGWALRDYAWNNPDRVAEYLAEMGDRLSPLTRREAAKNLSALLQTPSQ
jgi:3-methyladenine DNA glycosylase AlkD